MLKKYVQLHKVMASNMIPETALILVVLPAVNARNRLAKVRTLDMSTRITSITENVVAH